MTREKKTVDASSNTASVSNSETIKTSTGSINSLYESLPMVNLPLASDASFLENFERYDQLNENDYHRLTDIGDSKSGYNQSVRAARLPQKGNLKFVITGHTMPDKKGQIAIYSLSDEIIPQNRLQLYSHEKTGNSNDSIIQTFRINEDYRIIVSKHLNNKLIEQLTFQPDNEGIFKEVRDGKTVTVAYESFDDINYTVETFIWDYNASGGLTKKELQTENYRPADSNRFNHTDAIHHEPTDHIQMTVSPDRFASAPEKLSLRITNSSTGNIQFGADYVIENSVNGRWTKLEFPEEIAFIQIMYQLEPGKSENYDVYLYSDKIEYREGTYRIRKNVLTDEISKPYYAYFSIME